MTAGTKGRATPRRSPKAAPAPSEDEQAIAEAESAIAELEADPDSPIGPDGVIRPVVIGKRGKKGADLVHIFTLDEVPYYVPRKPGPAQMIAFQRDLRRHGRDVAVWGLVENQLGKKAIDALAESPDTDEEDLANVFTIVATLAFTALKRQREAADPS